MARIYLLLRETVASGLPPVCIVCGGSAATHVRKNFTWRPSWTSITLIVSLVLCLPLAIVMAIVAFAKSRQRVVDMPLCERHRHYMGWRAFWIYAPASVTGACRLDAHDPGAAANDW